MIKTIKRIRRKAIKGFINTFLLDKIVEQKIKEEYLLNSAMYSANPGVTEDKYGKENIIISLTSYNKRIYDVYLVIESLFNQTLKPNKVILWLAEDEFTINSIPLILKQQQQRGLEIGFCKDIKSYKKLIPTLEKYPDDIIITVDDDIIYPFDTVETLYKEWLKDKACVYHYMGAKIEFDKKKNNTRPYKKWQTNYPVKEGSLLYMPKGLGGVLYPPHCFNNDILREDLFMKLAPTADDIWFKTMTLTNNIPCKKVKYSKDIIILENGQDIALHHINNDQNRNEVQLKQVFDYYNIWGKIKTDL